MIWKFAAKLLTAVWSKATKRNATASCGPRWEASARFRAEYVQFTYRKCHVTDIADTDTNTTKPIRSIVNKVNGKVSPSSGTNMVAEERQ